MRGLNYHRSDIIGSGETCNYARRRSVGGIQRYTEALKDHEGESIDVRFETYSRTIAP